MDAARKEASNRAWDQDWEGCCFRDHKVTAPLKPLQAASSRPGTLRFRDHKVTTPLKARKAGKPSGSSPLLCGTGSSSAYTLAL